MDRVDQNLGDKARCFFAWRIRTPRCCRDPQIQSMASMSHSTTATTPWGYTHTISPRAVNDLRLRLREESVSVAKLLHRHKSGGRNGARYPRVHDGSENPGIPNLSITGYVAIGGQNMDSSNWRRPSSTVQWTDVFNYTAGAHSIAAGAEFFRLARETQGNNGRAELFTFTGEISGNARCRFPVGIPPQCDHAGSVQRAGLGQTMAQRILCFRQMERVLPS